MSYLSEYMAQDDTAKKLLDVLPIDQYVTVTVNGNVVKLADFIELHCTHVIEEASIKFNSGLVLGYGPKYHKLGWCWGVSVLPNGLVDYSHLHEMTDALHFFITKIKTLREFIRWVEVKREWAQPTHAVEIPLEHQKGAFAIDKDRI